MVRVGPRAEFAGVMGQKKAYLGGFKASRFQVIILALSIFTGSALGWDLISKSQVLRKEEALTDSPLSFEFRIAVFKTVYVSLYGYGYAQIVYKDPRTNLEKTVMCSSPSHILCPLWNFSEGENGWNEETRSGNLPVAPLSSENSGQIVDDQNYPIQIKVQLYSTVWQQGSPEYNRSVKFEMIGSQFVELNYADHSHFYLSPDCQNIDIRMNMQNVAIPPGAEDTTSKLPADNKLRKYGNLKFQMFAFQGNQFWINLNQHFRLYLKQGSEFASKESHQAGGNSTMGLGIVKTLIARDDEFCVTPECYYAIRIECENVSAFLFTTAIFNKVAVQNVWDFSSFLDEIREGDDYAVYDINAVDGGGKNWQWNLLPVFGNPDTYIQGDSLPAKLEDFHLSSDKDSSESIVVTTTEAAALGWSNSRYFQKIVAKERTSFVTFIRRTLPGNPQYLEPNVPVNGECAEKEIVVYNFGINIFTPETVTAYVDLKALTGDPDLYIKECSDFQTLCTITEEDISNQETLAQNSNKYFRYSAEINSGDALYIKVNCLPQSNFIPSQNPAPPQTQGFDFKNKLFTSSTCKFAIGVKGGTSEVHSMSKYQLVVKGFRHHEVLTLDMPRGYSFRLGTNDEKFFMLNVDAAYTSKTEHNKVFKKALKSVRFDFTFLSGDCKVYFSRNNPFPEESQDILYGENQTVATQGRGFLNFDNNEKDLQGVSKSMTFKLRQNESEQQLEEKMTGYYYVGIKTSELVFGEVKVSAEYQTNEGESPDVLQAKLTPLYLKQQQIGKIKLTEPQIPNFYEFDLELEGQTEVGLSFQPIQGQFNICLVLFNKYYAENLLEWNNSTLPCLIQSLNAPILISKQNSKLKYVSPNEGQNRYRFMVKVDPINSSAQPAPKPSQDPSDPQSAKEYLYTITLTLSTLHTEILLGSRYDFSNTENKEMYFDVVIPTSSDGFLVLLEGGEVNESVTGTLNQEDQWVSSQDPDQTKKGNFNQGNPFVYLIFSKKDIQTYCDQSKYKNSTAQEDESKSANKNAAQKQDESKTKFQCKVFVKTQFVPSSVVRKYSLMVNTFERPFMMNWGELKQYPAPFKRPILASVNIHASDLVQHGATINTYCRKYTLQLSIEVYFRKKVLDPKNSKSLIREVKRTFVSVENLSNLIHIPGQDFREWEEAEFRIMVNNVDAQKQLSKSQSDQDFSDYDLSQNLLIQVSSALTKLKDSIPIPDVIQEGVFKYYYFTKFTKESAIVSLNVIDSGEADLYISKNGEYPTLEKFDFKSDTFRNDQIEIPGLTGSSDEPDEEQQLVVGVYAKKNTRYEVILDMNPSLKLLPTAAGKVFSRQNIRKGDSLLITYENKELGDFELAFYTSKTRVSIYFAPWDEQSQPYFKNAIPQESSQMLLAKTKILGQTQRVTIRQSSAKNITWLFKVVVEQTDADTFFEYFIDNFKDPLQLKGDKIFKDTLSEGTFKVYEFYSDVAVDQANLRITLDYGSLNLLTNSKSIPTKGEHDSIQQLKSDGSNVSSLTFQMKSGNEKNNNLGLFKSYFFAIDVKKTSSFRIEINRDGRIFETLIPGIKLPYLWSSKESRNLYYRIGSVQGIRSFKLIFHSSSAQFRAKRNHFRRELESQKYRLRNLGPQDESPNLTATDVVNHFEFYTVNSLDLDVVRQPNQVGLDGKKLKKITANVIDQHTVENDGRISYIFNLAVNQGTFIVSPRWENTSKQGEGEFELKLEIELVVNGVRNVNANSWVQGFLSNSDEHQRPSHSHGGHRDTDIPKNPKLQDEALYQVIVPGPGTLEVKIEKCTGFLNIFAKQNGDVSELGIDLDHPESIQASSTGQQNVVEQLMENMDGFDKKFTLKYGDAGTFLIDLGLPKIANKGVTKEQMNENKQSKGSAYVIRTRFAPEDSKFIWPESFFFQDAYNPEFKDYSLQVLSDKVRIQAKRIQPSEELERNLKDIASAKVTYKFYVIQAPFVSVHSKIDEFLSDNLKEVLKENQKERDKIFQFNVCNPSEEFAAKKIPFSFGQSEYTVQRDEKGVLNWLGINDRALATSDQQPLQIDVPTPVGSHAPYYAVLNVQINLLGDYNDEIGDDIIIRGHSVKLIEAVPSNVLRLVIFCIVAVALLSAFLLTWTPSRNKIFTLFGFTTESSFNPYNPQNTNIEMSGVTQSANTTQSQEDEPEFSSQSTNFRSNRIETTEDDDLSLRSQTKLPNLTLGAEANQNEDENGEDVYGIE